MNLAPLYVPFVSHSCEAPCEPVSFWKAALIAVGLIFACLIVIWLARRDCDRVDREVEEELRKRFQ